MTEFLKYAIVIIIGYFLGNISAGQWIGRWFGKTDIREHGSGNQGATNMLRTLGYLPSILTLLGDALKGAVAALIGMWLLGPYGARIGGLCAVVGRVFPVMYRFKGGRGIGTGLGVLLVTDPLVVLCLLIIQVAVIAATKYMSVASLISPVLYFIAVLIIHNGQALPIALAALLAAVLIYAHRDNISRLIAGKENKLDFSKYKMRHKIGKEG